MDCWAYVAGHGSVGSPSPFFLPPIRPLEAETTQSSLRQADSASGSRSLPLMWLVRRRGARKMAIARKSRRPILAELRPGCFQQRKERRLHRARHRRNLAASHSRPPGEPVRRQMGARARSARTHRGRPTPTAVRRLKQGAPRTQERRQAGSDSGRPIEALHAEHDHRPAATADPVGADPQVTILCEPGRDERGSHLHHGPGVLDTGTGSRRAEHGSAGNPRRSAHRRARREGGGGRPPHIGRDGLSSVGGRPHEQGRARTKRR